MHAFKKTARHAGKGVEMADRGQREFQPRNFKTIYSTVVLPCLAAMMTYTRVPFGMKLVPIAFPEQSVQVPEGSCLPPHRVPLPHLRANFIPN